jgi:hypothetical protein
LDNITEDESAALKHILHVTGDALAIASQFNDDLVIRYQFITSLYWLANEFKAGITALIDNSLSYKVWSAKLVDKFDENKLFGFNMKDHLDSLLSQDEKPVLHSTFPEPDHINPFEDPDDDDDEGDSDVLHD